MRLLALALLLAGCAPASRFIYAEAAPEGSPGMRVNLQGGSLLGGPEGSIENVGKFVLMPVAWKGALPPGWTVPTPVVPAP